MPSQINSTADVVIMVNTTLDLYPGQDLRITVYTLPCGHSAMEAMGSDTHPSNVFACPECPYYGVTSGHLTTVIPRA